MNWIVRRRFEGLCRALSGNHVFRRGIITASYRDNPPHPLGEEESSEPLPASPLRTTMRYAEQLVSNTLYGAL